MSGQDLLLLKADEPKGMRRSPTRTVSVSIPDGLIEREIEES